MLNIEVKKKESNKKRSDTSDDVLIPRKRFNRLVHYVHSIERELSQYREVKRFDFKKYKNDKSGDYEVNDSTEMLPKEDANVIIGPED